jgi:hypothetical protein
MTLYITTCMTCLFVRIYTDYELSEPRFHSLEYRTTTLQKDRKEERSPQPNLLRRISSVDETLAAAKSVVS